jgi:hypothetical protein
MRLFRLPRLPRKTYQSANAQSASPRLETSALCHLSSISLALALLCFASAALPVSAQPGLDAFHWADFHDAKDAPTVAWVTQALKAEKWTDIREIGVLWDAAIVVTTERKTPQSTPASDLYTVWSVSLAKRDAQPLFHGVGLRILNFTNFGGPYQQAPELALIYEDCYACDAPSTFFTTLYYNFTDHAWRARWMRGDQAAVLWSSGAVEGVKRSQVYAVLSEQPGRDILATWSHFDYGTAKPAEDAVFEYSVDPITRMEQIQGLSGKHAEEMEQRLCRASVEAAGSVQVDPALAQLARGQDSDLCHYLIEGKPSPKSGPKSVPHPAHRPATSPPPNNQGKSTPPGSVKKP